MKIKIPQADFSRALLASGKSILPRANLPILANVLIKAAGKELELLATNLETATRVVLESKVESGGEATVNGKTLFEFISQLPEGEIIIEKLGEELVVSCKGYSGRFTTMPAEEFPAIPKVEKGILIELDCDSFVNGVSRVVFSAAQDEGRPILTGVLCDLAKSRLKMVATDGYRLSFEEINAKGANASSSIKFNIPAKALGEFAKIIIERGMVGEEANKGDSRNFSLMVSEGLNQVGLKLGGNSGKDAAEGPLHGEASEPRPKGREQVEFTSRLIEGEFPNWQKIIPGSFNTKVKIAKDEFIKLVRIASIFARDAGNIVKLKFEPSAGGSGRGGKFSVNAASSQTGSSEAASDVEIEGKGGEMAFNFRYLLEVLAQVPGNEVYFEMNESLNPGKLTTVDPKDPFFHIIMPVRLQS